MSDYQKFSAEKQQIDQLLESGYRVIKVKETLEGDFVEFQRYAHQKQLHLLTAEARKYVGTVMVQAQKTHTQPEAAGS